MSVLENLSISINDTAPFVLALQKDINKIDAVATDIVTSVTAASPTLTAAAMVGSQIVFTTQAATTATTATAALIVAAIPHAAVNDTFDLYLTNNNTGLLTVAAGTGVTLAGNTTVPTGAVRKYAVKLTNVTAGAEAVTITGMAATNTEPVPNETYQALANAAGQTWTVAQTINCVLDRSGAAGVSDTTPTAAALVAAFPNCVVGTTFRLTVRNANTGTLTVLAGSGVTLAGTTSIATVATRTYQGRFTNVTAASEAVTLLGLSTALN